jgi:hypothetical protein
MNARTNPTKPKTHEGDVIAQSQEQNHEEQTQRNATHSN